MKKLIFAIALVLTTATFAQDKKQARERLTPEQQTELQVKKMTLDLDLDAKQQKEINAVLLDQARMRSEKMTLLKGKREKGEKLSAQERFEMKKDALDHQIALKAKMKKILNPEQFEKWEAKKEDLRDRRMPKKMRPKNNN